MGAPNIPVHAATCDTHLLEVACHTDEAKGGPSSCDAACALHVAARALHVAAQCTPPCLHQSTPAPPCRSGHHCLPERPVCAFALHFSDRCPWSHPICCGSLPSEYRRPRGMRAAYLLWIICLFSIVPLPHTINRLATICHCHQDHSLLVVGQTNRCSTHTKGTLMGGLCADRMTLHAGESTSMAFQDP